MNLPELRNPPDEPPGTAAHTHPGTTHFWANVATFNGNEMVMTGFGSIVRATLK